MVIDGLFEGLNGRHTPFAYIGPGIDPVGMGVGASTGCVPCHVAKVLFEDRPGLGLARRYLIHVVVVGPPSTIAAPAICVAGNEILLCEILVNPIFNLDVGLKRAHRAKGPTTATAALILYRGDPSQVSPVKGGRE